MNSKIKQMTFIALMAAIISVIAPISLPIVGEVPISLATFGVMLAGAVLGSKNGTIATAIYLLLGAIGVPVFAGYTSGVGILVGVTGGYLIGYLPLAYCSGLSFANNKNLSIRTLETIIGMIIGTVILYIIGTAWFMYVTKMNLVGALMACVIPFIPGDVIKIVLVAILAPQLERVSSLQKIAVAERSA